MTHLWNSLLEILLKLRKSVFSFFTGVELFYSVVSVSALQGSESAMCILSGLMYCFHIRLAWNQQTPPLFTKLALGPGSLPALGPESTGSLSRPFIFTHFLLLQPGVLMYLLPMLNMFKNRIKSKIFPLDSIILSINQMIVLPFTEKYQTNEYNFLIVCIL